MNEASDQQPDSHSHNLVLETLMRDGVLGALGWLLVGILSIGALRQTFGWAALPWAIAIMVLNALDMTLLHSGSYYSLAILIGIGFGAMTESTWPEPHIGWSPGIPSPAKRAADTHQQDHGPGHVLTPKVCSQSNERHLSHDRQHGS